MAEKFEETNSQIAQTLDDETLLKEMAKQLRAASLMNELPAALKDEVDTYLEMLDELLPALIGAAEEEKPWRERATLQAAGVDPHEQWADSYRTQRARMAPHIVKLGAFIYAAGILPRHRQTAWRVLERKRKEYAIAANGNGAKAMPETPEGTGGAQPEKPPTVEIRPRYGRIVEIARDPLKPDG